MGGGGGGGVEDSSSEDAVEGVWRLLRMRPALAKIVTAALLYIVRVEFLARLRQSQTHHQPCSHTFVRQRQFHYRQQ